MNRIIFISILNILFLTQLNAMTVEEAYRTIPHRQTTYDLNIAKIEYEEALYLEQLFYIVDQAMLERVQTLIWFRSNGKSGSPYETYKYRVDELLGNLNRTNHPEKLSIVRQLITESIIEQSKYFRYAMSLKDTGIQFKFDQKHPSIVKSNKKLIQAYKRLMRTYPNENRHNKQAFFDHLCALDFI